MHKATLKCDEAGCRWSQEINFQDVPGWHQKPCPECGRGSIITDADLKAYYIGKAMQDLSDALDPEKKNRITVKFDTSKLR